MTKRKRYTWKTYLAESGAKGISLDYRYILFPPITGAALDRIGGIDVPKSKRTKYVVEWDDLEGISGGEKWFNTKAQAVKFWKDKKKSYEAKHKRQVNR